MTFAYPLTDSQARYDSAQVESFITTLFRNVDWEDGQVVSILGIGEKGTPQDGSGGKAPFRERKIIPPAFIGAAHEHLKRWAGHHVAGFIVPAVLHPSAVEAGDVTLDKVAALTAIIADLDSGDTDAKLKYAETALGRVSMLVASGGQTDAGKPKMHAYWLLNEPCEDVERLAAVRKELAQKIGSDPSFGRATQVIRIAGSVHAKNGKPSLCRILRQGPEEYSFDDLADAIHFLLPMPGLPAPKQPDLPSITGGVMDFTPANDTAIAALHRDIHENGEDLTRWGEFSKVAGFNIAEARAGRLTPEAAYAATNGWMIQHMHPAWPQGRFDQEFQALVKVDITRHGPFPQSPWVAAQAQPAAAPLEPTLARFPFAQAIPPRPWLLGRWLMRGKVTAVIAPGGVGKSSLMCGVALSLATGKEFLGKTIYGGPHRTWLWNLEDDGDSMARQRVAAAVFHGIGEADVGGRMFVDSGPEGAELCTAVEDRNGFTIIEPVFENITAAILKHKIDCLIIDPFVSSHRLSENDNNKIDANTKRWARVATATGCSIVLVHHSRKLDGDAVTADSARGAGALVNAARIALVLNRMTPEQAEGWGLDPSKSRSFVSVADDKHNLSAAESASWFELKSVNLGNGNEVHEEDSVGVVASWKPPRALDGVDLDHLFQVQRVLASGTYWADPQSKGDWAGDVVAEVLKIPCDVKGKKRVTSILATWLANGTLKQDAARCPKTRRMRPTVTVGRWVSDPHGANASIHDTFAAHEKENRLG